MAPEQKAAYVNAMILNATAEIEGMKAENQDRLNRGLAVAYTEQSFAEVPNRHGLHHNQIVDFFRE